MRQLGLHDIPAGRALADRAFATRRFRGAFLGGGHPAASGLFHDVNLGY
jgi:hypothetical protein